jgi:hypothetical protein
MLDLLSVLTVETDRGVHGLAAGVMGGMVDRSASGRLFGAGAKNPLSVDCTACFGGGAGELRFDSTAEVDIV